MNGSVVSSIPFPEFSLWDKIKDKRRLLSFDLEITARCNNNCRHCYINLPAGDKFAKQKELFVEEIDEIAEEAVSLGALWCLITGGEPLLREDFFEIYFNLKKKGLLVSVFTNASLITDEHVKLFKKYPPRDVEVSVYGVTEKTYERVTRKRGSFSAFIRGLDRLLKSGVKVRLKAMVLRSNVNELPEIARFCKEKTKDYFRFDPFLHLRYDQNLVRNEDIKSERLSPEEIVSIELAYPERFHSLGRGCDELIVPEFSQTTCNHLFHCNTGNAGFVLSHNGLFRLCSSLWHPDCLYDLKKGSLRDAWYNFVPQIHNFRSSRKEYLGQCRICPLFNLCMWCPAHAHLEEGEMDSFVDYFCKVAHARVEAVKKYKS